VSGRCSAGNADVPGIRLRQGALRLPAQSRAGLDRALERGALTLRGYDRVLRVAWTMADLAGLDRPGVDELGRALHLRRGFGS
jgi:magnesium chelatase family protein